MSQTSPLDIVGLCVFIATLLFAPEVAAVVGPYLAITLAAVVGASFALARRDRSSRLSAFFFFGRIVLLAILLTVGLAAVANRMYSEIDERLWLAPIALMVGFIGDDWPSLLGKVKTLFFAVIDTFRSGDRT